MKIFVIKTLFVFFCLLLLFRFTVISFVNSYKEKIDNYFSQENIILIKDKIRNELKIAINKERYLNDDDAKLISDFLSKICGNHLVFPSLFHFKCPVHNVI